MANTDPINHQVARILIFDSGVGGLSVFQAIRQHYPQCSLFYASDNEAFPYGPKSESELIDRVDDVLHRLQQATQADIIVVACNTASTIALPRIRERFSQPVIGVVPAVKPAAQLSQSKIIGLLATPGTVNRAYTKQLIDEFAHDCEVISIGTSELVQFAEDHLRGQTITPEQLIPIVQPLLDSPKVDTVILACTHFPLLQAELQQALPHITHWVDSGEAIARRVGYWLHEKQLNHCSTQVANTSSISYFTKQDPDIENLKPALSHLGLDNIVYLS